MCLSSEWVNKDSILLPTHGGTTMEGVQCWGDEVLIATCSSPATEYTTPIEIHSNIQKRLNAIIRHVNPYYYLQVSRWT